MNIDMFVFEKLPIHDTGWSMTTGADGAIYVAACCEHTGGVAAYMVRFDAQTDELEYLFDVGEAVGEPSDNGRATQCKIHYSLLPTEDGLIYGTTHVSGPPVGHYMYPVWGAWRDPFRSFRGAMYFVYDIGKKKVIDSGLMVPDEGSRAQALDEKRGLIYVVGYPRNHFMVYDLNRKRLADYGRIGSVNPQAIWLDPDDNAYTTDDWGRILKFDRRLDKLFETNQRVSHPVYQDGWHCVVYDVVAAPDPSVVYGVTWNAFPHVFKYDMGDGPEGRVIDLGPAHPEYNGFEHGNINAHHAGGMVFDEDGTLYYGVNRLHTHLSERTGDQVGHSQAHFVKMDVATGLVEDMGPLVSGDHPVRYFARGMPAANGDLVFSTACCVPTRLYRYRPNTTRKPQQIRLRRWG